jgi:hypothetical protein
VNHRFDRILARELVGVDFFGVVTLFAVDVVVVVVEIFFCGRDLRNQTNQIKQTEI